MGFFKNHFLPHEDNDHKPHFLREASVAVLVLVIVGIFALTALQTRFIAQHNDFLASVLPSVLVDMTNEDRQEHQLPPLQMDEKLKQAAQMKANHMAENGYFSHDSPTGETPWTWLDRSGYSYSYAGENLAINFTDSRDVEEAWMKSTMHRQNILDRQFTEVGIATAKGTYQGQETVFVVQMFARPAAAASSNTQGSVTQAPSASQDRRVAGETISVSKSQKGSSSDRLARTYSDDSESDYSTLSDGRGNETRTTAQPDSSTTTTPTTSAPVGSVESSSQSPSYASPFERLLTQPSTLMQAMYITLALLIALVLAAMVGVEIKKQHPKHAFYGVSLLVLILIFSYMGQILLFPTPIVV